MKRRLTFRVSPFPLFKCALPLSLPVVIRFSHVYKSYPNGALALKDVSSRVGRGVRLSDRHSGAGNPPS